MMRWLRPLLAAAAIGDAAILLSCYGQSESGDPPGPAAVAPDAAAGFDSGTTDSATKDDEPFPSDSGLAGDAASDGGDAGPGFVLEVTPAGPVAPFGGCNESGTPAPFVSCASYRASGWPLSGPLCKTNDSANYYGATVPKPPDAGIISADETDFFIVTCSGGVGTIMLCPHHGGATGVQLGPGGYVCD